MAFAVVAALTFPGGGAQAPCPGVSTSPEAGELHASAVAYRVRAADRLHHYTALVRHRGAAGLRMPLKDRTLYRAEWAARIHWWREGRTLVQVLAFREQTPLGVDEDATRHGLMDNAWDPVNDQLLFGFVASGDVEDDEFEFEHPLDPRYAGRYRFSIGDTLTLTLPGGDLVRAVELQVVPFSADVHRITGSLWIEPSSGALVRAAFRPSAPLDALRDLEDLREEEEEDLRHVPAMAKPWTVDLSLVAVEYALWDGEIWLPRSLRAEGVARAGIFTAPAEFELTYAMEEVVTRKEAEDAAAAGEALPGAGSVVADVTAQDPDAFWEMDGGWSRRRDERGRRTIRYLVPSERELLRVSPDLPPPIWEDAPGFVTKGELAALARRVDALPEPDSAPAVGTPRTFRWGLQRPDLVRYNRVEGLSLGVRGQLLPRTPVGHLSLTATARMGTGDREPNARLDATRESTSRRVMLSAYHELAAVDEGARHLGLGNSLTALLLGRDDGDYYVRSGASLEWTPPAAERRTFRVRAWAERHDPSTATDGFALRHAGSDTWRFRPNLSADQGWDAGGEVEVAPWWGTDPRGAQGGVTLRGRLGAGDWDYRTLEGRGALALPLPGSLRLGVEGAAGTSWGAPPAQRRFLVGGAGTLRGYEPVALAGTSLLRGRAELARSVRFGAVSVFSDAAWAGERSAFSLDRALVSAGFGLSLVDGLIRADAAWGLRDPRGFRLELYLDGIL